MLFSRTTPLLVCALVLAACRSNPSGQAVEAGKDPKPIADVVERTNTPEPIGKVLSDLDLEIRAWTRFKMTAATPEERNKARELEKVITTKAHARRDELIDQLQTGPLANRVVAASALGFTHEPEALSPLVGSLDDKNPEVVGNALLGLMILGNKDAPLERICDLMRNDSDPWVRTNAAQCLSNLVQAGARASCVLPCARLGISDPEPGVRSHSALVLAALVDIESLQALIDMVHDPVPLVTSAAVHSLVWIGRHDDRSKGRVARELVAMLDSTRNPLRVQVQRGLVELAGVSYGNESKAWTEWAGRLP